MSSAATGDKELHWVRLWRIERVGRVLRYALPCFVEVRGPTFDVAPTFRPEEHESVALVVGTLAMPLDGQSTIVGLVLRGRAEWEIDASPPPLHPAGGW